MQGCRAGIVVQDELRPKEFVQEEWNPSGQTDVVDTDPAYIYLPWSRKRPGRGGGNKDRMVMEMIVGIIFAAGPVEEGGHCVADIPLKMKR